MKKLWSKLSGPLKIGLIMGLIGALLTVIGLLKGSFAPLTPWSLFFGVLIGGGMWVWSVGLSPLPPLTRAKNPICSGPAPRSPQCLSCLSIISPQLAGILPTDTKWGGYHERALRRKEAMDRPGALALVGLCLVLCLGAVAFFALHPGQGQRAVLNVQPTAVQEEALRLPPIKSLGWGMDRPRGFGPVRLLFKAGLCTLPLLFFGLIVFVVVCLARRRCWDVGIGGHRLGSSRQRARTEAGLGRGTTTAIRGTTAGTSPGPEPPGERGEPEQPDKPANRPQAAPGGHLPRRESET